VWDTRQNLAAFFAWKHVRLGFLILASRLTETRQRVIDVAPSWRLRQSHVEDRRVDAMGCIRPLYPTFTVFNVLDPRGIVVI
jgi:hypothetical protein